MNDDTFHQEDSPQRRAMAQALVMILAGATDFSTIHDQLWEGGLELIRVTPLAADTVRFMLFERSNGDIYDSFSFENIEVVQDW